MAIRTPLVHGRDVTLYTALKSVPGRVARQYPAREWPTQAERAMVDALLANYYRPSKPTYRLFGGHVFFVGKVKHLSVADMIDKLVVKAVEKEMHRRGIGDLWGSRFSDELIEVAKASLVKRDGPHDARTPQEAARMAVAAVIDAGEHEEERAEMRLNAIIEEAVRKGW